MKAGCNFYINLTFYTQSDVMRFKSMYRRNFFIPVKSNKKFLVVFLINVDTVDGY